MSLSSRHHFLATALWLCVASGFAAFPYRSEGAQYVIQICIDGLGGKYLQAYLAAVPGKLPNFVQLQKEGAWTFNARCDHDVSETVPNHASMFTARPVLQPAGFPATTHHGYATNYPNAIETFHTAGNASVRYKSSVFDVVHDHGFRTAFFAGKTRLEICARSYDAAHGAPDRVGPDNGRQKIDFVFCRDIPASATVDAAIAHWNKSPAHFTFLHFLDLDSIGHTYGWGSPAWNFSLQKMDQELGRVLKAVRANPALSNRTALVITADHGGGGVTRVTHTEPEHELNYAIPFFIWGPGIPAGKDIYGLLANRVDPGTNRVAYGLQSQPLRAGDAGNLSLRLLGLPFIPDSFMKPVFREGTIPADPNLPGK